MTIEQGSENKAMDRVYALIGAWVIVSLGLLVVSACTRHSAPPVRICDGVDQVDALLESGNCEQLSGYLYACRERHPENSDFAALNRLQDATTYCYVKAQNCNAALAVTPRKEQTRFHLGWVASCFELEKDYENAAMAASEALGFWNRVYARAQVAPPLLTCISSEYLGKLDLEDQNLHMALCTYLNSALQSGRAAEVPERMQEPVRDPNWRLLLYYYYLDRLDLDNAERMMAAYQNTYTCFNDLGPRQVYNRGSWRKVCYPALRYLSSIGQCARAAEIYDSLKTPAAKEADNDLLLALGNCYLAEGDTVVAAQYANRLRELTGDTYENYLLYGYINLDEGNLADATFYFELASDIARRSAQAKPEDSFLKGELASALRMYAQALIVSDRALDAAPLIDEAWTITQQLREAEPDNDYWLLAMANSAHFRKDLDKQVELFLQIEPLTPSLGIGDLIEAAALTGRNSIVEKWADAALVANAERPAVKLVVLTYRLISAAGCGKWEDARATLERIKVLAPTLPHGCAGWYVKSAIAYVESQPDPSPELLDVLKALDGCSNRNNTEALITALEIYLSAMAKAPQAAAGQCR
jgi:tetratricopeptide (TPR) repeat protein